MFQLSILSVALAISCSVLEVSGLTQGWPHGTYGLFKAASGCPEGGVDWYNGSRTFDTEDTDAHNYFSFYQWYNNYLAGFFDANDITVEFCMKITETNSTSSPAKWPQGTYCILRYGLCPMGFSESSLFWDDDDFKNSNSYGGFSEGSIYWDDDDYKNHNSYDGVLPDGEYDTNTKMQFCCRSDAQPDVAIALPTDRAFVLLRYGYHCQEVRGTSMTEAFVRWDDEDIANSDSASGHHPFDDGGSDDHKLHFCHYRPNGGRPGIVG